jgi:hypothetical protein
VRDLVTERDERAARRAMRRSRHRNIVSVIHNPSCVLALHLHVC